MEKQPSISRRARMTAAAVVLGLSGLLALGALAGIGFAAGSSGAAQYQYGKRVTICHHTHSAKHPTVTITVAQAALKAHLRHGDTVGACAGSSHRTHSKAKTHSSSTHSAGKSGKGSETTTTTTTSATATSHGQGNHGGGNGGGNGSGHGHR